MCFIFYVGIICIIKASFNNVKSDFELNFEFEALKNALLQNYYDDDHDDEMMNWAELNWEPQSKIYEVKIFDWPVLIFPSKPVALSKPFGKRIDFDFQS